MDKFVVIEVGSTNTKSYFYYLGKITEFPQKTVMFKNVSKQTDLPEQAVLELIDFVNSFKKTANEIFVFGTSIFREIQEEKREQFLTYFKKKTGADFKVISAEQESEYTVKGVLLGNNYNGRLAIMIGGGGSTEVCIVENKKIIERHCNQYGAVTVSRQFENINDFKPNLSIKEAVDFCLSRTQDIKNKADILVIAGGDHKYHYECAGKDFLEQNKHYFDELQPYSVTIENAHKLDNRFIFEQDIKDYQTRFADMSQIWWNGTRSMRFCVRAVAEKCGAKFIIPTKINMCLGIINELKNENFHKGEVRK